MYDVSVQSYVEEHYERINESVSAMLVQQLKLHVFSVLSKGIRAMSVLHNAFDRGEFVVEVIVVSFDIFALHYV